MRDEKCCACGTLRRNKRFEEVFYQKQTAPKCSLSYEEFLAKIWNFEGRTSTRVLLIPDPSDAPEIH